MTEPAPDPATGPTTGAAPRAATRAAPAPGPVSDGRSAVFFCPYCGEEDLEPDGDEAGRWHCRSCERTFTVRPATR